MEDQQNDLFESNKKANPDETKKIWLKLVFGCVMLIFEWNNVPTQFISINLLRIILNIFCIVIKF